MMLKARWEEKSKVRLHFKPSPKPELLKLANDFTGQPGKETVSAYPKEPYIEPSLGSFLPIHSCELHATFPPLEPD